MKGTTIIELTDRSGNVERTVDHNYMTNALSIYFKNGGELNPSPFGSGANDDWIYNLLGGVMCFDETIQTPGVTDDPEIVEPPLGVGMTANAINGLLNTGDPTELGSYNETESGWQEDGTYRQVWDWTTSQGNGVIKAVSLCPRYFAFEGIGNASNTSKTMNPPINASSINNTRSRAETGAPVALYDNALWYMDGRSATHGYPQRDTINISNTESLTFHRKTLALTEIDIRSVASGGVELDDVTIELPVGLKNTTMYIYRWQQRGSHLYLLCAPDTAYTTAFTILNVNLQTKTLTTTTVTPSAYGATENDSLFNFNDKYFIYGTVAIDYINLTAKDIEYVSTGVACLVNIGERFYTATSGYSITLLDVIDPSTGDVKPVNKVSGDMDYTSSDFGGLLTWNIGYGLDRQLYTYYNWTKYRNPRFLATVNNLSQSVTKTSDKTMKVSYVLDFSDEAQS